MQGESQGGWIRARSTVSIAALEDLPRPLGPGPSLPFVDGCHALFLRLGEGDDPAPLLAEHSRLERGRSRVLSALRRHCAAHRVALKRGRSGLWAYRLENGAIGSLSVGANLTRALQRGTVEEALEHLVAQSFLPGLGSNTGALPQTGESQTPETPWPADEEVAPLFGPRLLSLDWGNPSGPSRDSRALGVSIAEEVTHRLGAHRFFVDLAEPGIAQWEFSDRLDSFRFDIEAHGAAHLLERGGRDTISDRLVLEFNELDAKRGQALLLLEQSVSGLCLDKAADGYYYLGKVHREYAFPVGPELTQQLRGSPPKTVVHSWLERHRLKPSTGLPPKLRHLPRRLEDSTVAAWQDISLEASRTLARVRKLVEDAPGEKLFGLHTACALRLQFGWYIEGDRWAAESWWRRVARAAFPEDPAATELLILQGDGAARLALLEELKQFPHCFNEEYSQSVLWLLDEELPWPLEEEELCFAYLHAFGSPPPALARLQAMQVADAQDPEEIVQATAQAHPSALRDWLTLAEVKQIRRTCSSMANRGDLELEEELLTIAASHRWPELTAALVANESFLTSGTSWGFPGRRALLLSAAGEFELASLFAIRAFYPPNSEAPVFGDSPLDRALWEGRQLATALDRLAAAIAWSRCPARD